MKRSCSNDKVMDSSINLGLMKLSHRLAISLANTDFIERLKAGAQQ
ncbi:hypothetical protein [Paenibacillus sp. yr247]|nr:hypothetical protein [Paenibacillus sp. yr247]